MSSYSATRTRLYRHTIRYTHTIQHGHTIQYSHTIPYRHTIHNSMSSYSATSSYCTSIYHWCDANETVCRRLDRYPLYHLTLMYYSLSSCVIVYLPLAYRMFTTGLSYIYHWCHLSLSLSLSIVYLPLVPRERDCAVAFDCHCSGRKRCA